MLFPIDYLLILFPVGEGLCYLYNAYLCAWNLLYTAGATADGVVSELETDFEVAT